MTSASVPPALPLPPSIPGLVRLFGDPRFCTDSEVVALAFPSANTLCTVEEGGVLRIWDAGNGGLRTWRFLSNLETLWQFTPDARWLASAGNDLCLWDVRSGEPVQVHKQPAWVTALAFRGAEVRTADLILATGDDTGQVRVWAGGGERLLRTLHGHRGEISALEFSPDGARLASAGEDRRIVVWDLPTGRQLCVLTRHTDRIVDLAWHARGQHLISAGWDHTAHLWDATTGAIASSLRGPATQLLGLSVPAEGRLLAAADAAGDIWLWDLATRQLRTTLHTGGETGLLAFNPTGDTLAAAGADRPIRLFDVAAVSSPQLPRGKAAGPLLSGFRRNWNSLALKPDGVRLAEVGERTRAHVWDLTARAVSLKLVPSGTLHTVAFSPNGRLLALGSDDGQILLWNLAARKKPRTLRCPTQTGPITSLAFTPDSARLAAASAAGTSLCLWQLHSGEPEWLLPDALDGCTIESLAISADGGQLAAAGIDWLATGGTDGLVQVWNLANQEKTASITWGSTCIAFHPSGQELALALLDSSLCLWDLRDQEARFELTGLRGAVTALAYRPDGLRFATSGEDRFLRLWNTTDGQLLAQIELDTEVKMLAFAPDGRTLFTANANTSVYQLDVEQAL